jgi:hypothetical protein
VYHLFVTMETTNLSNLSNTANHINQKIPVDNSSNPTFLFLRTDSNELCFSYLRLCHEFLDSWGPLMPLYPLILTLVTGGTLGQDQSVDAVVTAIGQRRAVARLRFASSRRRLHVVDVSSDLPVVPRWDDVPTGKLRMRVLPPQIVRQLERQLPAP